MICRSRQRIDQQPNNDGREKLMNLQRLMMGARNGGDDPACETLREDSFSRAGRPWVWSDP